MDSPRDTEHEQLMEAISDVADLKQLDTDRLPMLAEEIRRFLIEAVSKTGGHIGPNLGVVELTIAIHRVFDSPDDPVIFDTGHQSYVHKILTGRADMFDGLRTRGGLTGYPNQNESPHDFVENSHASTSLSYAEGLAKAACLKQSGNHVVAVIGDGALTGGMAWEALNNIAAREDLPLIIVVNDNGRSYAPTVGGLAKRLTGLRLDPSYEPTLDKLKNHIESIPVVGKTAYSALHAAKTGLKDALSPQGMFSDLGLKYVGPIDGHDLGELTEALEKAKNFGGPVLVHALTEKGHGWAPARADEAEQMHAPSAAFDPITGESLKGKKTRWTNIFSESLIEQAEQDERIVALTAAMPGPTGVAALAERMPDRVFDVGIAEQHATTSAAGLALAGMHPVVAVYATFMNRAFDQVLLDVAMHRLPVTFVLDRAGITGPDGPSHYGMWDLSLFRMVPGLKMAAPRDAATLRTEFAEAVAEENGPTMLRFPTGGVPENNLDALDQRHGLDVLHQGQKPTVLLFSIGAMAPVALRAAELLEERGLGAVVVDPRWVDSVGEDAVKYAAEFDLVASIEDGVREGGYGDTLSAAMRDYGVTVPFQDFAVPKRWIGHGTRAEILEEIGLTPEAVSESIAAKHRTVDPGK
ncbi:1-deoxy-D-xylulose-5-phosphate synthase [Haloglycomyces albus]|uniref:1-deoxy-D-xylulose-5-phosphate synthase n=1 Tax=Haloglycomyces albus TaxID=526067 RepID=UPI00046D696B|nr:1-deoxy-D-xylulose-5-phosphate synthase [Haloglycomyces albus]